MGLGLELVLVMKTGFGLGIRMGLSLWVEPGYGEGWVWVGEEVMDEHGVGLEARAGVKVGVEIADGLSALTLPSPHTHGQPPEACPLLFTRVPATPFLCRCPCCL